MADTRRTFAVLATLFADNTAGAISAQDLRDFLQSMTVHTAAAAPGASDDETLGFDAGHIWKNTASTPDSFYKCMDASTGAAVWVQIYPASAAWGSISGTLADQTDLQNALDAKADASSLATVATTGDYADLDNLPSLGSAAAADAGDFATAAQGALAGTAVQPSDDAGTLGSGAAADGQVLTADGAGGAAWETPTGGGGGASAFTDLTDAPASYSGAGGKLVAVNSGATGLEFVTGGGGGIAPLDGVVIVKHGAVAGTARPTAGIAYWLGSVAPTNKALGDFWLETGAYD